MMSTTQIQESYPNRLRQYLLLAGYISMVMTAFLCPITITGTAISIVAAMVFCLISGEFFVRFQMVRTNPITLSILILIIIIFAAMFWSIASWHDRLEAFHKYQKLLYFIFLLPLCIDPRWRQRAINAFLLAMVVTIVLSYLKQYAGLHMGKANNGSYVFHSHIETSYFVAFSTYIFAQRAIYGKQYRWLYSMLAVVFTFQEFFINSGRTGWMVYFGLVILFFVQRAFTAANNESLRYYNKKIFLRGIALGTITLLLLAVIVYNLSSSFHKRVYWLTQDLLHSSAQQLAKPKDHAPELRITFFKYSLDLSKEHPIMGMGTASFQAAYKKHPIVPGWGTLNTPHNEYLLMLVQGGLVGLSAMLYFFLSQWLVSFHMREDWQIAQALILSGMISCCFNAFLYTSVTGHFYVLCASLLFAGYCPPKENNKIKKWA